MKPEIFVRCDASTRKGNPGASSYGFVALDPKGGLIRMECGQLGVMSSLEAEYMAILRALEFCWDLRYPRVVEIQTDALTVAKQLRNGYLFNSGDLNSRAEKVVQFAERFEHVHFIWIPRAENQVADRLTGAAWHATPDAVVRKLEKTWKSLPPLSRDYAFRSEERMMEESE